MLWKNDKNMNVKIELFKTRLIAGAIGTMGTMGNAETV
jgi:hypothetical protein